MTRALLPLLVLCSMIFSTGCAPTTRIVTQARVEYRDPPEELLHCPDSMPLPPPRGAVLGAPFVYILRLEAWGRGCQDRLDGPEGSVSAWIRQHRSVKP